MKINSFSKLSVLLLILSSVKGFSQTIVDSVFSLKWKTEVGLSTYKTNIQFYNNKIYLGSNGLDYTRNNDPKDGVFEINPKSGEISHQFVSEQLGDNDVNGIAIGDNKIFFGGDNFYFYCFDLNTKSELWKFKTPYDVESCPVLTDLNKDGKKDVVFTVQNHGVFALNGSNGEVIWKTDSIECYGGNSSPTLWDVNNDGIKDIIVAIRSEANSDEIDGFKMKHYGDYYIALNGKNGKILWQQETGSGVHASGRVFVDSDKKEYFVSTDSYGEIVFLDKKGTKVKQINVGYSVYSSPIIIQNFLFVSKNNPWEGYPNNLKISISKNDFEMNDGLPYYLKEEANVEGFTIEGKISSSPVIADILNIGTPQVIVVSESGDLLFVNSTTNEFRTYKLASGAEATPFVGDIDGDGKLEILIAGLDGFLYCYDTKSSQKAVFGDFRQGLDNTGVLK